MKQSFENLDRNGESIELLIGTARHIFTTVLFGGYIEFVYL